jgi:hypothetical protein
MNDRSAKFSEDHEALWPLLRHFCPGIPEFVQNSSTLPLSLRKEASARRSNYLIYHDCSFACWHVFGYNLSLGRPSLLFGTDFSRRDFHGLTEIY